MKPTKGILDPEFKYTSAARSDIRRLFARVRREQREAAEQAKADAAKVTPIHQKGKTA